MSDAPPTSDLSPQPGTTAEAKPSRFAPLLSLVRRVIDYGKQLAASLQNPTPTTDTHGVAVNFGSYDFSQILASILRGLQRAGLLHTKLARMNTRPGPHSKPIVFAPPKPRAAAARAQRSEKPAPNPIRFATPEQIAKQVRSNPIGVVLADICRDLGITRAHPLWRELHAAIIDYNGSIVRLDRDLGLRPWLDRVTRQTITSGVPLFCRPSAFASTGPPPCPLA
jgi:hypothetical protein